MEKIAPGIWKLKFGVPDRLTPRSFMHKKIKTAERVLPDVGESPKSDDDFIFRKSSRGIRIEYEMDLSEKIYGTGLQLKSFCQNGKKKTLRTNSDPVADTGDSHAPVPFFVSTRGYGILIDTARYVTCHFGTNRQLNLMKRENGSLSKNNAGNTEELYGSQQSVEGKKITIEIPATEGVELYIFAGPELKHVVQRYNLFSGGGCMPPMWGLGNWYRIYTKADQGDALGLARQIREDRFPCDVFGIEPGWQTYSYPCSFEWDKTLYPNPDGLIYELETMGYKVNLWEHAYTHPMSPIYEELLPYSGDHEVFGGIVPDLSIPEAKRIFGAYHRERLIDKNIAGFKLDECDSSDFIATPWSFPDYTSFPSGMDGEQMHSMLGLLYQYTIYDEFHELNKRTYGQVRASHAFAASMPFVLYSDLYDHKDFIRGMVNMGFSGLLWSPEVRQCDSLEELVRRIQTTVFSPQSLVNAWMIPNPPWLQYDYDKNMRGEWVDNVEEAKALCRTWFELRMSFLPYLYSAFHQYSEEGTPPFRALVMDYPEDPNTFEIDDAYLMGGGLLVAPMVAGEMEREVYLPVGGWYCFWSHQYYEGGRKYTVQAGLDRIPVFVKNNTLLPLAMPVPAVSKDSPFEITVFAFGNAPEEFVLYEDDGSTFNYEKGEFNEISLKWTVADEAPEIRQTGNYDRSNYEIVEWKRI